MNRNFFLIGFSPSLGSIISCKSFSIAACCRQLMATNRYTVKSLLEATGVRRNRLTDVKAGMHSDHVVELQLVVAALNQLKNNIYSIPELKKLVMFFNEDRNLQELTEEKNQEKGVAVRSFINGDRLGEKHRQWIKLIQMHWGKIQKELEGFDDFKSSLSCMFKKLKR